MHQNGDVVGKQCGKTLLGKNGSTMYVMQGSKKMKDRKDILEVAEENLSQSQKGNLEISGKGCIIVEGLV